MNEKKVRKILRLSVQAERARCDMDRAREHLHRTEERYEEAAKALTTHLINKATN